MGNSVAKKSDRAAAWESGFSLYAIEGGRKYLNASESQRALEALSGFDVREALFVMLLAGTGARISEVLALTSASFQLDRGIVAFETLKQRRRRIREVPVSPTLMEALCAEFALADLQRDEARAYDRLWRWHRVTAWRMIKEVMAKAGIKGAAASPRGFRHGFGVGAVHAGIPLNVLQRWFGHARLTTTAIYTEVVGPEELALAERMWGRS